MIDQILQKVILNNQVLDYIVAISIFILAIIIIRVFRMVVLGRLKQWAKKTKTTVDDLLIAIFKRNAIFFHLII